MAVGVRKVRRVDGERGEGGCDPCGGGTRIARGDRGQEVGVVVPYPGRGVISVRGAVNCPDGRGERYGGYADWGDRGHGYWGD